MKRILEFLYIHLCGIIFIVLEIVGILTFYNGNAFQRSVIGQNALELSAEMSGLTTAVVDYFNLTTVNRELTDENMALRTQLEALTAKIETAKRDSLVSGWDTFDNPDIEYVGAKIVYMSIHQTQNHIVIDKGSADGVERDMGVVANGCAVGVVDAVSEHYAIVLPLINTNIQVSAKILNNDQLGIISWDGTWSDKVELDEVPSHVKPKTGQKILTSGHSTIFPENVLIGRVSKTKSKEVEGFNHIIVDLAVDYGKLKYVGVVRYRNKAEFEQLTEEAGI